MLKRTHIFIALSLLPLLSQACEIPVFRYALERWHTDPYRLQINIPQGQSLSSVDKQVIEGLASESFMSGGNANFSLQTIEKDVSEVSFELYYPKKSGIIRHVAKGSLAELKKDLIMDSPSRVKLEKLILSGKSIVWLLIPGPDKEKNSLFRKTLEGKVSKALASVKLSDGIIKKENTKNEKLSKKELENILHSQIPLELSFDVIEVDVKDQRESVFIDILLRQNPRLMDHVGPIAFPVFGRGRVLDGVIDAQIGELEELTIYLSSHCSCTVKEENPGIDLLMNVPWADHVAESQLQFRDVLPPLSGLERNVEEQVKSEIVEDKGLSVLEYLLTIVSVLALFVLIFFVVNRTKSH